MEKVKWHSAANPSQGEIGNPEKSRKRKYIPSRDKRRSMAHESKSGGRAMCEICGIGFCMDYMRLVKIAPFHTGFACVDCVKEKQLQKVNK